MTTQNKLPNDITLNPYKPSVLFVGHSQTVQNRRHKTWRLIRFFTVCYQNVKLKKNTSQQPLSRKWTGPIDNSGKIHSAYMGYYIQWAIPSLKEEKGLNKQYIYSQFFLVSELLLHGHQSSSFIIKYNDSKFMRGTSYNAEAEAGLDSCK